MLCNVVRKPIEVIFREFLGTARDQAAGGAAWSASGDVKYHLGTAYDRSYPDGRKVRIELLPNPSHLEAVNPLVVGKARARMDAQGDARGDAVLPVIVHGDAAFAGQGVVYETMQMVALEAYGTGGTIHVICNNQVGFTATPEQGRSTMYASDLGKAFGAPIFHVNADDPEAVCRVFETAVAWRHEFKTDVIVDLVGYRKFGHNEIDEPTFTQPMMYAKVRTQPSVLTKYLETVAATEPVVPAADVARIVAHVDDVFARAFEAKDTFTWDRDVWGQNWQKIVTPADVGHGAFGKTGASPDALAAVGAALSTVPDGFKLHRRLRGRLAGFAEAVASGEGVDWALGEALAFGTLLLDGMPIRFTGQDVQRGTFTHRHAVVHDQDDGREYCFVNHIHADQPAKLAIHNSFLSEYGVLGFELGYSYESPDVLCIWEAQFGDFVNGAQIVIDQFLSSGEAKWMRQTGLVVLLPHGYQGQGPEHSSCRIERFLQNSDEDPDVIPPDLDTIEGQTRQVQLNNWQIINPSPSAREPVRGAFSDPPRLARLRRKTPRRGGRFTRVAAGRRRRTTSTRSVASSTATSASRSSSRRPRRCSATSSPSRRSTSSPPGRGSAGRTARRTPTRSSPTPTCAASSCARERSTTSSSRRAAGSAAPRTSRLPPRGDQRPGRLHYLPDASRMCPPRRGPFAKHPALEPPDRQMSTQARPRRADFAVPVRPGRRVRRDVRQRGGRLGPGGAQEPGRLVFRPRPHHDRHARPQPPRGPPGLLRPRDHGVHRRGLRRRPRRAAEAHHRRRPLRRALGPAVWRARRGG